MNFARIRVRVAHRADYKGRMMKSVVIRKYKNRRLYDTQRSEYITKEELLALVKSGKTVEIQEVGTEADVTVETLLQLLVSDSRENLKLIPSEFVHFLIRSRNNVLKQFFRGFFPFALNNFLSGMKNMTPGNMFPQMPMNPWQNMMPPFGGNPWFNQGMPSGSAPDQNAGPDSGEESPEDVEELKKRLQELEDQLKNYKDND